MFCAFVVLSLSFYLLFSWKYGGACVVNDLVDGRTM